ncbi:MAG: hypothetical protein A2V66_12805 [Ignavibacteria bacterium RBG_13_36_8]|nr:MAG: hypothetical protein A2V66_12805 [Ignavibacteria bacterium RBG_13_36_8]
MNTIPLLRLLINRFDTHFGELKSATVVLSPASLILLGDHTHYNDGISLSVSIDKYTAIALRKRKDNLINVLAGKQTEPINVLSDDFYEKFGSFELRFIRKLVHTLGNSRRLNTGFDCAIMSDIPQSVGLGVYTSLLVGVLNAINVAFKLSLTTEEIIETARRVELELIGKISNKAHHYSISKGKNERIFYFDVRNENYTTHSLPFNKYKLVICDTNKVIKDVEDICNERIIECEVGAKGLRLYIWGINNLRDVQEEFLEKHIQMIPKRVYHRCLYNVKERKRVENALRAFKKKDYVLFGRQMFESHTSLSEDYNLSSDELDFLVEESKRIDGVLGSKMISCTPKRSTINLVESGMVNNFINSLSNIYKDRYDQELECYVLNLNEAVKHIPYKDIVLSL